MRSQEMLEQSQAQNNTYAFEESEHKPLCRYTETALQLDGDKESVGIVSDTTVDENVQNKIRRDIAPKLGRSSTIEPRSDSSKAI
jgi:hypothetical protein